MNDPEKLSGRTKPDAKLPERLAGGLQNVVGEPEQAEKEIQAKPTKWSFGVLNDKYTDEVPGNHSPFYEIISHCNENTNLF